MKTCGGCDAPLADAGWRCARCGFTPSSEGGIPLFAPELAARSAGFRPEYFAELARLEEANFWFRARNELILWAMRKRAPGLRSFLEIGCGTGFVLAAVASAFPTLAVSGSEVYREGLDFAAARVPRAALYQMDARRIPFADEFDAIGAFDVIEHIEEDAEVLAQMHKALRRGGTLFVTVPQHAFLWSRQDELACHVRRYGRAELDQKLRRAGFVPVDTVSFVSLLFPLMMLSRLAKPRAAHADAMAELRLGAGINALFGVAMELERGLIRAGLRAPFGGSLLAVARKQG